MIIRTRSIAAAVLLLALSPVICHATLKTATIAGSYDGATQGTYEQFTSTTPFYLSNPSALSNITVTGTVDVSGLSTGGGGSVIYVGLYQPDNTSTVILEPRLHAGYFGDVEGGIGQGDANDTGENVQQVNIPLASASTSVTMSFDAVTAGTPTGFSATFATPSGPDTRTVNYNAGSFAGQIDFSMPVYPYVMAFASDTTQTASFDVTFTQAVPEASSFLLVACVTGLGLLVYRKRRT